MRKLLGVSLLCASAASAVSAQELASPPSPAPASAAWSKEPDPYRGLKWGAPLSEAAELLADPRNPLGANARPCTCINNGQRESCRTHSSEGESIPDERVCGSSLTIGSIYVRDTLIFFRDRFTAALMDFDSKSFEEMGGIFVEKYGEPSSAMESPVHNRMGMKATNPTLAWKGPAVTVILTRFASTLAKSSATIATNDFFERLARENEEKRKNGAKVF